MLRIFSAFAEFEREIIRERTLEGLARVRAQGKKLGRPRKVFKYEEVSGTCGEEITGESPPCSSNQATCRGEDNATTA